MRSGLVVVLAVTGFVLVLPFWFAWLSSNPRRWRPVERVLGDDFTQRQAPGWLWKAAALVALGPVVMALVSFRRGDTFTGLSFLLQAATWALIAISWFGRSRPRPGGDGDDVR